MRHKTSVAQLSKQCNICLNLAGTPIIRVGDDAHIITSDAGSYQVQHGFFSNFSAVVACLSNIGPAFEAVGPYSSYASYSGFSLTVLNLTMLLGRLEIFPVLILFNRRTWKKI